jgi:hypothetical protein
VLDLRREYVARHRDHVPRRQSPRLTTRRGGSGRAPARETPRLAAASPATPRLTAASSAKSRPVRARNATDRFDALVRGEFPTARRPSHVGPLCAPSHTTARRQAAGRRRREPDSDVLGLKPHDIGQFTTRFLRVYLTLTARDAAPQRRLPDRPSDCGHEHPADRHPA